MHSYKVAIFLGLVALVSWASAGFEGGYDGSYGGDDSYAYGGLDNQDSYHPPNYSYEYSVHDPLTGDIKSAQETREGDSVKGYYTMKEADGSTREVHYTADSVSGFNAIVTKTGQDGQKVEVHGNQHHI